MGRKMVLIITVPHMISPSIMKFTPLRTSDTTSKTKRPKSRRKISSVEKKTFTYQKITSSFV